MDKALPIIGITMGDAAGIGPEIVVKALGDGNFEKSFRSVVIGDIAVLQKKARDLKIDLEFADISDNSLLHPFKVSVYNLNNLPEHFVVAKDSAETGRASAEYISKAVDLWREQKIDAIATAPISKAAIGLAGYKFPGHTEFLAELTDTKTFAMSFFADKLRIILLSIHLPLKNAIDLVKKDSLIDLIRFSHREVSKLMKRDAKIAVAGLNPHASENGMFGTEERDEIIPAIDVCSNNFGIDVSGPYSPDTIFLRGYAGEFDAVIACYHDQATIAAKCLSFGTSVNVTLGLPLIRTSVDHGTAYDIAGKNVAEHSSMVAAIKLAAELASKREI